MKAKWSLSRKKPWWSGALALMVAGVSSLRAWRDRSDRQKAEDKLRRLDRQYAMVSGITALGIRVRDREDLFSNACRIAVDLGEFQMAWIALVDPTEPKKIVPMGWAGLDEQAMVALRDLFSTSEGALQGSTLAARAIREKAAVVSNDVEHDEGLIFGKMHAASGVRSIAVLPLIVSDRAIGVFALYTSKLEYFDAAGLARLTDLAGNVAFATDYIEKQGAARSLRLLRRAHRPREPQFVFGSGHAAYAARRQQWAQARDVPHRSRTI